MANPHNEGDVRDLREWAKAFPNANGAYETAVWVATYDMIRALLNRDLETLRDLEDCGSYGHSEGGCVWCWSTGEHNPTKAYPVEHMLGCPIKAAIDRLVAAGAVDSIGRKTT